MLVLRTGATRARLLTAVLACLAALAVSGWAMAHPPAAAAATREWVCPDTLTVRDNPGGNVIGTLYWDNQVDVSYVSGAWANVYAYGNVNARGWVLVQYLTTSPCAHG